MNITHGLSMIEKIHLKILNEIDQQGSLTAAAKSLCVTQSALSHTMRKLEAQLGTAIWQKEGRNIRLTQAGEYLHKEAKRLIPQFNRIEETLAQYAVGDKGILHIGMECHPCYKWLLKTITPFLQQNPNIDIDIKQRFQFGGMAALFNHDIDLLVTPDPLFRNGIEFEPVFAYEQVLVTAKDHPFATRPYILPEDMSNQVLYTYPVEAERLDIYKDFLTPAHCSPKQHKTIETTEIMLQLVAANRGVATLPHWLVKEFQETLPIVAVRLGKKGISKQIHLGVRTGEKTDSFAHTFLALTKNCHSTDGQ